MIRLIVSILVLVDAALRHSGRSMGSSRELVSILVLVDAALRPGFKMDSSYTNRCFNPCFSGCRPATGYYTDSNNRLQLVSILVLVDAALRQHLNSRRQHW